MPRNQRIVSAFIDEGLSYAAVGRLFGITRERVRQILVANGVDAPAILQARLASRISERRARLDERRAARRSIGERFMRYVQKTPGCWLWVGGKGNGYGRFQWNGTGGYAHRFAYQLLTGRSVEGKELDHICHNRLCVRPDHLEVVTHAENVARSIALAEEHAQGSVPSGPPPPRRQPLRLAQRSPPMPRLYQRDQPPLLLAAQRRGIMGPSSSQGSPVKPQEKLFVFMVRSLGKKPVKESLAFVPAETEAVAVKGLHREMDHPKSKKKFKKGYDWKLGATFTGSDLATILSPESLDPINTAAALRYAALEHRDILGETDQYVLNNASDRILNKFFN